MFAVVDVETTGGHASKHKITEIGIVIHDGVNLIKEYTTLLNPEREIPINIEILTGISNQMVANAPLFEEKAEEIREVLADHVFVAHNVNFDLSFMQNAFSECGIDYNPRRLCTVRYTRKIVSGLRSYSLKNLCNYFGLNNKAAHRAWGDAYATAQLLGIVLERDKGKQWQYMIKRNKGVFNLPANLPAEEFHNLPEKPGVYYFYNKEEKPIYIGKASNLKKRVSSHFGTDKDSKKSQSFKREIYHIHYELTGSEFVASLLEDHEIRHYWPAYNKAQKKTKNRFGVFAYKDTRNNWCLVVNKIQKQHGFLMDFYSQSQAHNWLLQQIRDYNLNPKYCGAANIYLDEKPEVNHNANFENLLKDTENKNNKFLLKTPGRYLEEDGFVFIENLQVKGMGFVSKEEAFDSFNFTDQMQALNSSITTTAILRKALEEERYAQFKVQAEVISYKSGLLF